MSGNNLIEKINALATRTGQSDKALAAGIDAVSAVANAKVSNVDISGSNLVVTKGTGASASTDTIPIPSAGAATKNSLGTVQIGDNINVNNGIISVGDATASAKGVAQLDSSISDSTTKVPPSSVIAAELASYRKRVTAIYVDGTNGDDDNDGLTAATAVKTVNRGLTRARIYQGNENLGVQLHIAAGTYAEDAWIINLDLQIILDGDVTVSNFGVSSGANVDISTSLNSVNFTVTGFFEVNRASACNVENKIVLAVGYINVPTQSFLHIKATSLAVTPGAHTGIYASHVSEITITSPITFTGSSAAHNLLFADIGANITASNNIVASGTCNVIVVAQRNGSVYVGGTITSTGVTANAILYSQRSSSVETGAITITNGSFSGQPIVALRTASIVTNGPVTFTGTTQGGRFINADDSASIILGGKLTLNLDENTTKSISLVVSARCSSVAISSGVEVNAAGTIYCVLWGVVEGYLYCGQLTVNATFAQASSTAQEHAVVRASQRGYVEIVGNNGTGTAVGRKYYLSYGGAVYGSAKIPGSQAGVLDANTYCFAA